MASKDTDLYGIRSSKKASKEISSSTSLGFTTTLSGLLSASTRKSLLPGRRRASKTKPDIFAYHNKGSLKRASRDLEYDGVPSRAGQQDIGEVDGAVLHHSKRRLEQKVRVYNDMKRGDYVAGQEDAETLIDFDRKWVEREATGRGRGRVGDESSDDMESGGGREELVEYEDDYGRVRKGTRADAEKMERRKKNRLLGAEELDRMSARPAMPGKLIYGDTVQTAAFDPDAPVLEKMEEIAKKRDRSMTPPEAKHYEADKEFRIKGVGFYNFSKDEKTRTNEMRALEGERMDTERERRERQERKEKRRREIEGRKEAIAEKRARKQADVFLEGFNADVSVRRDGTGSTEN